jgi:hypothetical protein
MTLDLQNNNTVEKEISTLYSLFDESPTDELIHLLRLSLVSLQMTDDCSIQAILKFPSNIVLIMECYAFGAIKLIATHNSLPNTFRGNKENLLISLYFFQLYTNSK